MELPAFPTLLLLCVAIIASESRADESPGFFLKITKNVPRLGKRNENFVMKNMKTIPRLGRSDSQGAVTPLLAWLWELPSPSKRRLPSNNSGQSMTERELSVVQPVNSNTLIELLDRDAIPSEHVKFVHWKDFDRALQADTDLYAKVIQLGRRPDQRLKQDLNLGSFVPIFGNANEQSDDFMMYNKDDDSDLYGSRYDRNFLQYNRLR